MEKIETLEKDDKPKKKKRRLKKWVKVTFSILTILIVFLAIVAIILSFLLSGASTKSEVVDFTVDSGSSVYSVGKKLEKEGIIRSYIAYKTYVKIKNISVLYFSNHFTVMLSVVQNQHRHSLLQRR